MIPRLPAIGILLLAGGICSAVAADPELSFQCINPNDYQSFVQNWDEKAQPVRAALVRTPAEWNAVFHPAPVMRGKKPFAPADSEFATNQFLVVARVMPAPTGEAFRVEQVTAEKDVLTVRYAYVAPRPASYDVKEFLGLRLPARPFTKVFVEENGKTVATLEMSAATK